MKDNTLLFVGAGVLAVVLLTRKKYPATLPNGYVTVGPVTPSPLNQQQGILLPFFNKLFGNSSTPASSDGLTWTNINNNKQYEDPGTLEITDSTGVTAYSSGGYFDPNLNQLDTPHTLDLLGP